MRGTRSRRSWIVATAMLSLALTGVVGCRATPGTGTGSGGGNSDASLCRTTSTAGAPTTGYWAAGPHQTQVTKVGDNTYFHPADLAGEKHPVVLWGNGTSVTPACYVVLLTHWASYGFIVAAANTTNSGSGQEMLAGLTYLATANGQAGNKFYGAVDLAN